MERIEEEKEVTVIKNEDGHVVARVIGKMDIDALTRCLYGFKQKVEQQDLKKSG